MPLAYNRTPQPNSIAAAHFSPIPRAIIASLNGLSYIPVTLAGCKTFDFTDTPWYLYALSVCAGLCYVVTTNAGLRLPAPSIEHVFVNVLAWLSISSASAFYIGAYAGSKFMNWDDIAAETIGFISFALRAYFGYWATVRFCNMAQGPWAKALAEKNAIEICKIFASLSIGTGYSICTSDAIFQSTYHLATNRFGVAPDNEITIISSYSWAALGVTTGIPLPAFYVYMSLKEELCFAKKTSDQKFYPDRYTASGFLLSAIMIFSALGSALSKNGQALNKFAGAEITFWLKISFISTYGLLASLLGTASLCRRTGPKLYNAVKTIRPDPVQEQFAQDKPAAISSPSIV
ncbi:MAG: hypothetical protein K0S29_631 [Gammaproteobacteria bacterium]|nr:hypothetical protein [Gammaproteobacteria bacterium]